MWVLSCTRVLWVTGRHLKVPKCQVLVEEGGELWLWGPVRDLVWVHLLPI